MYPTGRKDLCQYDCFGSDLFLLDLDQKLALKVVKNHFGQDEVDCQAFELGWKYGADNFQKLKIDKVKSLKRKNDGGWQ